MTNWTKTEFTITPYKLCVCIFIQVYCEFRDSLAPRQNGRMCVFVLDLIRQSEYHFKQLLDLIEMNCADCPSIRDDFKRKINYLIDDDNYLIELVKHLRDCINMNVATDKDMFVEKSSVAGLYLRKVCFYFDTMSHQTCMRLFDDLMTYLKPAVNQNQSIFISPRKKGLASSFASSEVSYANCDFQKPASRRSSKYNSSLVWQTPGVRTRSSQRVVRLDRVGSQFSTHDISTAAMFGSQPVELPKNSSEIVSATDHPTQINYFIHQQMGLLNNNELKAASPKDLYESLRKPVASNRSDSTYLRYLNILRLNEYVASKQLLMAYFDMVSDSVSRSYSSLNHAIWYIHHRHYRRAIECLQECFCSAQAADDDKCLLDSLMWLARTVIQAKQKNSSKYSVVALLKHVEKRSAEVGKPYVQAMSAMTLEQITGPTNDSEQLKKSHEILKQVSLTNRQHNHLLGNASQPNPLDKDDCSPSAEVLAVRHSMNDVLTMHYALISAHFSLMNFTQSSALVSQTLLHFDLVEKCGNEDILLVNENTFIAIRNLAYHVWNTTRDFVLVRDMLVELCSRRIPIHRTDHHAIWRQALAEITFEYYLEHKNWSGAAEMISYIKLFDIDGAQLREAERLKKLSSREEALKTINDLINRITKEENDLVDLIELDLFESDSIEQENCQFQSMMANHRKQDGEFVKQDNSDLCPLSTYSIEHKSFIKSRALLLRASLLDTITSIFECLGYATKNKFIHVRTSCFILLSKHLLKMGQIETMKKIMNSHIMIEVLANGTKREKESAMDLQGLAEKITVTKIDNH